MATDTYATTPATPMTLFALRSSAYAAIAFLLLLASLHVVRPDLDPSWRVISEYAIGPYGWLMVLAFLSLALSCVALVLGIQRQISSIAGRVGLLLLLISAAGMTIAAIFTTDPLTAPAEARTTGGNLHQFGAMLDVIPLAAVLVSWSLVRHNQAWASARRSLYWTAGLTWIGLAAFFVTLGVMLPGNDDTFGPNVLIGWPNRLMVSTYCLWLIGVARCAITLSTGTAL